MLIDRVEIYTRRGHKYLFMFPCFNSSETISSVLTSIVTSTPFVDAAKSVTIGHPIRTKFIFHVIVRDDELPSPYFIFESSDIFYKLKSFKSLNSI